VLNLVLSLPGHWRIVLAGPGIVSEIRWLVLGAIAAAIPFLMYRVTLRRLPAFASIAMLMAASSVVHYLAPRLFDLESGDSSLNALVVGWFGAAVVLLWNREFSDLGRTATDITVPLVVFATGLTLLPLQLVPIPNFEWFCLALVCGFGLWAAARQSPHGRPWKRREDTMRILRSPASYEQLHVEKDGRGEVLASTSGERFRIRDGIAEVVRPEDLMGLNGRYNRLYETIGGTYDDVQRVACALEGIDREEYVRSYLEPLEVKAGDRVLETSIGTGLNLKYLPRSGVHYVGLDLSRSMLAACQLNLRRWGMEADLLLGNAEYLPFEDDSFDVVFHVGGINFFSDRKRAIDEMIRVAKPGSRILIADETEEHVKEMYERGPVTGGYFKNRAEAVTAPVDLVPEEMRDVELRTLAPVGKNRFYVLTFLKPLAGNAAVSGEPLDQAAGLEARS
jgi:ubiquinone/menaquinone biosynthesis C-methylase UbiE